jgi:hypothetical protein
MRMKHFYTMQFHYLGYIKSTYILPSKYGNILVHKYFVLKTTEFIFHNISH